MRMDWIFLFSLLVLLSDAWALTSLFKKHKSPPQSPESPTPGPKPFVHCPKAQVPPVKSANVRRGGWYCSAWPGAAVIYSISPEVGCPDSKLCKIVKRSMKHFEKYTCIRFKARSGERDYVTISWDPNIDSEASCGRLGGQQHVTLGPQSLRWPIDAVHEFGHVVGLPDEVTRPDRDKYIKLDFENLREYVHECFKIRWPAFPEVLEEPFDYASVMMYSAFSASKDGKTQTIFSATDKELVPRETVRGLSDGDIRKIDRIYKCQGTNQDPSFPFDVTCSFADDACGFQNLNDAKWLLERSDSFSKRFNGKFMYVDFATIENAPARLASVNFHGLSPLDKTRGPKGCARFSYFISIDGPATLTLSQTELESPHQEPGGIEPTTLWNQSKVVTKWDVENIPVNIERPFMLIFEAQFEPGTKDGIIGLGDFVLTYTPCEGTLSTINSETHSPINLDKSFRSSFRKKSKFRQLIGF